MGSEATTTLRVGRKTTTGIAQLEGGFLLFKSSEVRLKIPFTELRTATAKAGAILFDLSGTSYALELGEKAPKWLDKILNPPSLLDKLGIKPGMRVCVINVDDDAFRRDLSQRIGSVDATPRKETDVVVFGADSVRDLERIGTLKKSLKPNGAIWIVHTKGKGAPIRDIDVFSAAKRANMVDNKVASFSSTHTTERLVIPVASRPKKA